MIEKFIEFTKKNKWNNIFFKTTLLSIILIFIPIVIVGSIIIMHNTEVSETQFESYRVSSHKQIQNTWHDITTSIYETHTLIQNASFNSAFVSSPDYAFDNEQSRDVNMLTELLKSSVSSSPFISSIYVYNTLNDYIISTISNSPKQHFVELSWYDNLEKYSDRDLFLRQANFNRSQYVYLTSIKRFSSNNYCYAVYNLDYSELKKHFTSDNNIEEIYITNADDIIVFSSNSSDIGNDINSIPSVVNASKNLKLIKTTDSYGQTFYTLSKGNLKAPFSGFSLLIVILMILLFISSTLSSYIITIGFKRSLIKIISTIPQDISPNTYDVDSKNEISFITNTISKLISQNNKFEEELALQLSKLKKSQVMALQEQINPHFLFNTLNLINLLDLSEEKENHPVSKISMLLSDILRYILNTEDYLVPLEHEISYLEKYIKLQRIKYDNDFKVIWNIDENTKHLHIVKFSLQPIVENAIIHGFTDIDNNENTISISTSKTGNMIKIIIHNNGVAIDAVKLSQLNNQISNNTIVDSKHIGLLNVCLRYKLLFNQNFSGKINSAKGKGTTVSLEFPAIESFDL